MDGQINFVSQPHAGSTFTFTTFFQRCNKSPISESKAIMLHPLPSSFKGLSVLLVDRKPKRATVTKYRLQRLAIANDVVATIELYLDVLSMIEHYFIPVATHEHFCL
jgi:histidine kinase 2/3/4 (cytokinin receptor)